MPTFDFVCQKCAHAFEVSRPFGTKGNPVCPKCKSRRTKKQLGSVAIQFKGGGFYKTDSKPAPKPAEKAPEAPKPETPKVDKK